MTNDSSSELLQEIMSVFIDEAKIYVKAGNGGDGCNSFYRNKRKRRASPDGGPGGNGGDVIFEADNNIHTLLDFQYRQHFKARSGSHGSSNHKKGSGGEDLHIKVPPGTIVKDAETGLVLRDIVKTGDSVVAAKGGRGGRGNSKGRQAEKGESGEERTLLLELKLIADVGIVGFPNAGKSTLISKISRARPKIANYPFTTKEPALGVVNIGEGSYMVVADMPGLIEGAHKGRGLGHKFLRHIERTKVLIHLIDVAAVDGRDPYEDYLNLNSELCHYSLIAKPQVIALNKIDRPEASWRIRAFKKRAQKRKLFLISALTGKGVSALLNEVHKIVKTEGEDVI